MAKDMTTGSPAKLIFFFAMPMLIGNIFQQFYNMVDAMVVGRYVSVEALAAVGATGSMLFTILGFAMGLTTGFSIIISQRFGAGDDAGVRKAYAMSIYLSLAISIVMTVLGLCVSAPLLHLMNTPEDTFAFSQTYLNIIFIGVTASIFYNLVSSVLRALGDSKTPLYFLILASIINVVLDLFFVLVCHLAVAGVAIATILAQLISVLLCLIYMNRKYPILHLHKVDWKIDWLMVKELVRMGLPAAFQNSVTGLGVLILQGVVNGFGSTIMASYTAATKVEQLSSQAMNSFGLAMATYTGQNLGARRFDRIRQGIKSGMVLTLSSAALGAVLVVFFGKYLTQLFVSAAHQEVIENAQLYLNIIALPFFFLAVLFVYRNTLQGLGNAIVPMISGFVELALRILASLILAQPFLLGYAGVCAAGPLAWLGAAVLLAIAYYRNISLLERFER